MPADRILQRLGTFLSETATSLSRFVGGCQVALQAWLIVLWFTVLLRDHAGINLFRKLKEMPLVYLWIYVIWFFALPANAWLIYRMLRRKRTSRDLQWGFAALISFALLFHDPTGILSDIVD